MAMVLVKKPSSTLTRYKRSGLSVVPGTAVRLGVAKNSGVKRKSKSPSPASISSTGSGSRKKNKVRSLKSRVWTFRHNIFNDKSVLGTRTRTGGYVRQSLVVNFSEKYYIGKKLGTGGFGTVWAGVRISDGVKVAIKHVARSRVIAWDTCRGQKVPQELRFLLDVQHVPGVVKMLDFYERDDSFIYIMERPDNYMDLFDFITKKKTLTESMARDFFRQVTDMVIACSESNIVHRDIKDENILVNLDTFKLTLIDFGSGGLIKPGYYTEFDGTRVYAPAEWISNERYTWEGMTVWSLGILLYDMVCGDIPWQEDEEIAAARLQFPVGLSPEVRKLIGGCLRLNTTQRLSLSDLKTHPWLTGEAEE